jgi:hypothetical protein
LAEICSFPSAPYRTPQADVALGADARFRTARFKQQPERTGDGDVPRHLICDIGRGTGLIEPRRGPFDSVSSSRSMAMATHTKRRSVYEQAIREHEALEKKLAFVNEQLERREVPLEEVVKLLEGLRSFFLSHFRKEEDGGLFESVVERAPHLSRLADKLMHEHYELLERLDGLLKFARRGTGQPLCWRMLSLRLQDLTSKLHQHESEENGMLQMAYTDDLGTKD